MRTSWNRWRRDWLRRWVWQPVFGEVSHGLERRNTRISPATMIEHEDQLVLGDDIYIGPFNLLEASGGIVIDDGVQITSHCAIVTHTSHRAQRLLGPGYANWPLAPGAQRPGWIAGPVHIGAYSFIGPHSLIEANTRIAARGVIVCAGSFVRRRVSRLRDPRGPASAAWSATAARRRPRASLDAPPRATRAALRRLDAAAPRPRHGASRGCRDASAATRAVGRRREPAPREMGAGALRRRRRSSSAAASSRGFAAGARRAACPPALPPRAGGHARRTSAGGNVASLLKALPRFANWLRSVDADWINAHYLTSHGTLAWMARRLGVRAQLAGSAWGSDILVAPEQSAALRWAQRVLRDCAVATSDSARDGRAHAQAGRGQRADLSRSASSDAAARRRPTRSRSGCSSPTAALEEIYDPMRVLQVFARVAGARRRAASSSPTRARCARARAPRGAWAWPSSTSSFVGRLDAAAQAREYDRARWYLSLPTSDSVAVSVLEAMAHGCVPVLSDVAANHELVRDGDNGLDRRGRATSCPPRRSMRSRRAPT